MDFQRIPRQDFPPEGGLPHPHEQGELPGVTLRGHHQDVRRLGGGLDGVDAGEHRRSGEVAREAGQLRPGAEGGHRLLPGHQAAHRVDEQHGLPVGQDVQHLLVGQAPRLLPLQGLGQLLLRRQQLLPPAEEDQPPGGHRQIADVGTAGGAAAHHQHRRVLHPGLGGDELRLREKAADALDQGHPVIPGITAAAVADADLPSIRHGASSGWSVPRPAAPG